MGVVDNASDSNQKNSLQLMFGGKAIISIEIVIPSIKVELYNKQENPNRLWMSLDLLEEIRERAWIRIASY